MNRILVLTPFNARCFSIIASVVLWASAVSAEGVRTFVGYAVDVRSEEPVYVEVHREIAGPGDEVELETTYSSPDGTTIAVRSVDFSVDPLAPHYRFDDVRTGYIEGLRYEDGAPIVFRRRMKGDRSIVERSVDRPAVLVADAGFDRLVTSSWNRLMTGEKMTASFLVPSRMRSPSFDFEKVNEWVLDGEPVVTFRMAFRNPLLRLLVDPIRVTYHRELRCLMRYEGLSNLQDLNGDNYSVRIDFPLSERTDWVLDESPLVKSANDG